MRERCRGCQGSGIVMAWCPYCKGVEEAPGRLVLRIRYQQLGGHVHCRMFTAPDVDRTFAKCGEVVFDEREWEMVRQRLHMAGAEVIPE